MGVGGWSEASRSEAEGVPPAAGEAEHAKRALAKRAVAKREKNFPEVDPAGRPRLGSPGGLAIF